jgi:hypothetical protein
MHDAAVGIMGGMNKDEARRFLRSIGDDPQRYESCAKCDCYDPTAMDGLKDECECDCHPREEEDDRSDAEWREDRAIYRYERDRKGGW